MPIKNEIEKHSKANDYYIQYDRLADCLKNATLHEIHRFSQAIQNELKDPHRIATVRRQFQIGDTIEYFHSETNTYVTARVLKKNTTTVSIQHQHNLEQWRIPYSAIKLNSRDIMFTKKKGALNKNSVKVGDWVGFNHDGKAMVGQIKRINPKTVSLITKSSRQWRVSYHLLYPIFEAEGVNSI